MLLPRVERDTNSSTILVIHNFDAVGIAVFGVTTPMTGKTIDNKASLAILLYILALQSVYIMTRQDCLDINVYT